MINFHTQQFQTRSRAVLQALEQEAMNTYQIGDKFGISHSTVILYLKFFKQNKLVYIDHYKINDSKRHVAYYRTGNKQNAVIQKFKTPRYVPKKETVVPIIARCDIAAQWLRNPICY